MSKETICANCGLQIFERPMRDSELFLNLGEPGTVWDLVWREYDETTRCYGTGAEFGTPEGHDPVGA